MKRIDYFIVFLGLFIFVLGVVRLDWWVAVIGVGLMVTAAIINIWLYDVDRTPQVRTITMARNSYTANKTKWSITKHDNCKRD